MANIYYFSPVSGSPGQTIRIIGNGFTGATQVKFGGTNAAHFNVIDDGTVDAVVGSGSSGQIDVITPSGGAGLIGFTFVASNNPVITSVSPNAATPGGKVTIQGQGFTGATSVMFGGVEALFFRIISDTQIEAYPNFLGSNIVSVTNASGTTSIDGFVLLLNRVKLPDLPLLGRQASTDDRMYTWDNARGILCQANIGSMPFAAIPGSGGGDTGNIYTVLGSPFKVRISDSNYAYDEPTNTVTITDVRLLGKQDYVVFSTETSNEFENDRLQYDSVIGSVKIVNYKLASDSHITIYADGVVTTAITDYLNQQSVQLAKLIKVAAPFLPSLNSSGVMTNPGGLVAWFRPAIEIPDGWAEWLPGRSMTLVGQDPSDIASSPDNPEGLNRPNGSTGGSVAGATLTENNLPLLQFYTFGNGAMGDYLDRNSGAVASWTSHHALGNQDYDIKQSSGDANMGVTNQRGKSIPDAISIPRNPYRIVNFIYSTQTAV